MNVGTRFPVRVTWALIACSLIIAASGTWFYASQKEKLVGSYEIMLSSIAHLKSDQIAAWRSELIQDGGALLLDAGLIGDAQLALASDTTARERVLARLADLVDLRHYQSAMLVDTTGSLLLSTPPGLPGQCLPPDVAGTLREALDGCVPRLTELHCDAPDSTVHLSLVLPVAGADDGSGPAGGIVIRVDPRDFLFPLIGSWPVPSRTSETLIVRAEGDSVLFLNELRHLESSGFLRLPLSRTELPAVQAVLGRTGTFRGIDYRGVEVLSAIELIEGSTWFMVSKIDLDEALAGWGLVAGLILGMTGVTILAACTSIVVLWQRSERLQYRRMLAVEKALRGSEVRLQQLLGCLMAIRNVNQLITQVDDPGELIRGTCRELTANLSFTGAWIALYPREGSPALHASAPEGQTPFAPFARGVAGISAVCVEQAFSSRGSIDVSPSDCALPGCPVRGSTGSCRVIAHALRKDGERFGILVVTLPEEYSRDVEILGLFEEVAGDLSFALAKLRESSARRRAEALLAESEERHRRLFENAPVGIFRTTRDCVTLEMNPELARMLGCGSPADAAERYRNLATDLCSDPESRDRFESLLRESGEVKDFEFEGILPDGGRRWFSMSVRIRDRGPDAEPLLDGFIVDVTSNRLAEEERGRLEDQLRQAQKLEAIGRLAGGVAHDFNNMLQSILGYTEMALEEAPEGSPIVGMLGEIGKAGRRSAELTSQLLAFARKQPVRPRVLDLNDAVTGTLNLLGRLIGEDIELSWIPGEGVRPVEMDPAQLGQILANLAVNSRDAIAGSGKLTIETANALVDDDYCSCHPGALPGSYSVLVVSDDGCGMDRETLTLIFEPFFTTKPTGMGTGLGLATVYGITKQNGGFVNVYSEPGRGSTFRIYLPWCEGGTAPTETVPESERVTTGAGERILVVEDDPTLLQLAAKMLADAGYEPFPVSSPSEAMELSRERSADYDLLLTDVVLPGMSGRDLYDVLRTGMPRLACLYMSGYTANVITHHGVLDSGVHFLQKPFGRGELAAKVRQILDERQNG